MNVKYLEKVTFKEAKQHEIGTLWIRGERIQVIVAKVLRKFTRYIFQGFIIEGIQFSFQFIWGVDVNIL